MREIIDASVGAETFRDIIYFNFIYNGVESFPHTLMFYTFFQPDVVDLRYFKRC